MGIPNYLMALANHEGPAIIHVKTAMLPVKIMDIDHEYDPTRGIDRCEFKCMVVNQDLIKTFTPTVDEDVERYVKNHLNGMYGRQNLAKAAAAQALHEARQKRVNPLEIKAVKFGNTTTVTWKDGSKTSIVCPNGDIYTKEYNLSLCFTPKRLGITRVIFNDPVTVTMWEDNTKTVVKCQEGDVYSKQAGLFMCISKKSLGNKGNFNDVFHEWIPEEKKAKPTKDISALAEAAYGAPSAVEVDEDE